MKFILSEVFSGLALYLFLYVVLIMLVIGIESPVLYWLLWIICIGGAVALTFVAAGRGQDIDRPSSYFAIAAAAVLAMGCLALSPHMKSNAGYYAGFAGLVIAGIPLGVGAVRLLLDPWRKLTAKALGVGVAAGLIGVVVTGLVLSNLRWTGFVPFVPLPVIGVIDLLGFDLFPSLQSGSVVRRTLLRESTGALHLPGILYFLALLFQGLQSTLAALWDTLLMAVGVLMTSWVATRLLLGRS